MKKEMSKISLSDTPNGVFAVVAMTIPALNDIIALCDFAIEESVSPDLEDTAHDVKYQFSMIKKELVKQQKKQALN